MVIKKLRVQDMDGITVPKDGGTMIDYLGACAVRAKEILTKETDDVVPVHHPQLAPVQENLNYKSELGTSHDIEEDPEIKLSGRNKKRKDYSILDNGGDYQIIHDKPESSSQAARRNKKRKDYSILDNGGDYQIIHDMPESSSQAARRNKKRREVVDEIDDKIMKGETSSRGGGRNKKVANRKPVRNYEAWMGEPLPRIDMPVEPPPVPEALMGALMGIAQGREVSEGKLVIQKRIEYTDTNPNHNRLSIPESHIVEGDFLKAWEKNKLRGYINGSKKREYIRARIVEPSLEVGEVKLTRWPLNKRNGKGTVMYVLNGGWKNIVERNWLRENGIVQVWAFRMDQDELVLALVRLY